MPADLPDTDDAPAAMEWPSHDDIDVSEAVDVPDEGSEDAPAEEAPEAPAEDTPAPEAPEGEVPEGEQPQPDVFDRKYVEDLRNENATWRVKAQTYEKAFAEYDENERAKFLDLAAGLADESRSQATAREMVLIGKRILEAYGEDVGELAVPDPNRPLTAAELDAKLRQADEQRSLDESIRRIAAEVKDLGYEEGTPDHYLLLSMANANPQGDLKVAHDGVQAYKKAIVDEFIKEHSGKARKHLPSTPDGGGTGQAPAEAPEELTGDINADFAKARDRISAMLNG